MKIIATTGFAYSGYELIHEFMALNGFFDHEKGSGDASAEVCNIQSKIYDLYDLPKELDGEIDLNPDLGQICQDFAKDLMLEHLDFPVWGWGDDKTVPLLNFWKNYDPQFRFILVYSSPAFALAQVLKKQKSTLGGLHNILQHWLAYNKSLLTFYKENQQRSLLINARTWLEQPDAALNILEAKLGRNSGLLINAAPQVTESEVHDNIAKALSFDRLPSYVIEQLVQSLFDEYLNQELSDDNVIKRDVVDLDSILFETLRLEREDNTISLMKSEKSLMSINNLIQKTYELYGSVEKHATRLQVPHNQYVENIHVGALREYYELNNYLEKLTLNNEYLALQVEKTNESSNEKLLIEQLHQVRDELEEVYRQKAELEVKNNNSEVSEDSILLSSTQYQELEKENELLLIQMHKVQEELENYYFKYQDAIHDPKKNDRFLASGVKIDFRNDKFEGDNWYYAEVDGRWSGPGLESIIRVPPLAQGIYELKLEVVDAMDISIVQALEVDINGEKLNLYSSLNKKNVLNIFKKKKVYPLVFKSQCSIALNSSDQDLEVIVRIPKVISPSDIGNDKNDQRKLGVRVKSLQLLSI
jgi:hypothetical protein